MRTWASLQNSWCREAPRRVSCGQLFGNSNKKKDDRVWEFTLQSFQRRMVLGFRLWYSHSSHHSDQYLGFVFNSQKCLFTYQHSQVKPYQIVWKSHYPIVIPSSRFWRKKSRQKRVNFVAMEMSCQSSLLIKNERHIR